MDNPGDCRTAIPDSTTASSEKASSSNDRIAKKHQHNEDQQNKMISSEAQVSSAIQTSIVGTCSENLPGLETKPSSPPTIGGKAKAPQAQQQHHQFRAPQQYVKHKKSSSALFKKNKTWNKRQNKNGKLTNQAGTIVAGHPGCNVATAGNLASTGLLHANNSSKADLENIQNLRNQPGGYHYYHRNPGIGERGGNIGDVIPPAGTAGLDKLPFPHGHAKQPLYNKKMSMHNRGHHQQILCSGAGHNNHGSGLPMSCCHINGCASHNSKDNISHNGSLGSNANASATCCIRSKFFLPDKRPRKEVIIPPTKFLLGGNISDPLNLSSLQNETSNTSTNNTPATTPRRSPITTPPKVEVIIPPNIHDPLHLLDPVDTMEYEKQLTSPMKRGSKTAAGFRHHKHRHRKNRKPKRKRNDSYNSTATTASFVTIPDLEESATALSNNLLTTNDSVATTLSSTNMEMAKAKISAVSSVPNEKMEQNEKERLENNIQVIANTELPLQTSNITTNTQPSSTTTVDVVLPLNEKHEKTSLAAATPNPIAATTAMAIGLAPTTTPALAIEGAKTLSGTTVAAIAASSTPAISENVAVVGSSSRERLSRDFRLDLSSTTASGSSTCGTMSVDSNHALAPSLVPLCNTNSGLANAPNPISGGVASAASVAAVTVGVVTSTDGIANAVTTTGANNRKRKISESSNTQKAKKPFRYDTMDKIVSPVVPQPGAWKRPPRMAATGARKPATRRSRSISESEALSPIDESNKSNYEESGREDTPDLNKMETISENLGSPLSTISAATSVAAGENEASVEAGAVEMETATSNNDKAKASTRTTKMPKFPLNGGKYRYGNYDRYSGCRNLTEFMDVRLQVFQRNIELFENKDVLDIGCNSGYMTISIGRNFAPKSILGIDIDEKLIAKARRNLALYVRIPAEEKKPATKEENPEEKTEQKPENPGEEESKKGKKYRRKRSKRKYKNAQQHLHPLQHFHPLIHHHHLHMHYQNMKLKELQVDTKELFPISFPLTYGTIYRVPEVTQPSSSSSTKDTPSHPSVSSLETIKMGSNCEAGANSTPASSSTKTASYPTASSASVKNTFPNNVYFRKTNYVLKDESLLSNENQQYDVIICLSVTKWIHLNFGDAGLKLAFKRMFNQLRPGGKLILEAQNWASYKNKKNLTEDIYLNYSQIEFFPNKFHEYLLSSEVGFSHSYTLGVPRHLNKGFCRPIQLYAKGDYTPNHVRWSDAYYPQTPYEAYRGIYATMPPRPDICQMSSTRSQNYDTPHYTGGASGPYSCRPTPMHQPTSQYYNPLETDSYQPSYDMEYLNHMYVFASPLYQTVWSPPASMRRNSSTHTPIYGSVRDAESDGDGYAGVSSGGSYHRHVYPPNDDTMSPNANAGNAFNSIRDPDTDDSNQPSATHVYATTCGESSSSPNVNHNFAESIDGLLDDDHNPSNEI